MPRFALSQTSIILNINEINILNALILSRT